MPWDPSLVTGINKIDEQHMALVEKIEEFLVACEDRDFQSINAMLIFMETYVANHFDDEETMQIETEYPDYHHHKVLHEYFIEDFTELKMRIDTEGVSRELIDDATKILLEWIIQHISGEDMTFGVHYKKVKNL